MKSILLQNKRGIRSGLSLSGILLAMLSHSYGSSMVTVSESPNSFTSSLSGTSLYDFNSLKTGLNKNVGWNGVGTFDQIYVIPADQYGGAPSATAPKGSNYSVQGIGSPVKATTLTLNTPSSYFGFYWSAGDSANMLQFYSGNKLVGEFTTKNLLSNLPGQYYGNPLNRSQNKGEPYAFINFYGDQSTHWDKIVLTNASSSGFESDNYTSRVQAWTAKADGAINGRPVVVVDGAKVTAVSAIPEKWSFSSKAPAAPAPPFFALLAFAAVVGLRGLGSRKSGTQGASSF
ncbi:MAG: hypothetical protein WCO94_04945 [Verrucomicrobiota bacterium]